MNLILFSVTTFAVLDYFYRFMRFVSTDLAKIAKFLCFYSKSGISYYTRGIMIKTSDEWGDCSKAVKCCVLMEN